MLRSALTLRTVPAVARGLTSVRARAAPAAPAVCAAPRSVSCKRFFKSSSLQCTASDAATAEAPAEVEDSMIGNIDIRVGKILAVEKHPDADSLYVETVDCGEEEPRTIVSGLVNYVPLEDMEDRSVIVLANLKARNMRGIKSFGMLLCASDSAHENVEPLAAPEGAEVGERIFFYEDQEEPATANKVQKKKMWEKVQPALSTTEDCVAQFKSMTMMTSAGPVACTRIPNGSIS